MEDPDQSFEQILSRKRRGGVALEVFVSDGIWLGGPHDSRPHEPFLAIAPSGWDSEEEVTFFKDEAALETFIDQLRTAGRKAFGDADA